MQCEQYQEWMSERLDGELDSTRIATLDRHLEACTGCREEWQLLNESWQLLGELPEIEPSPIFRAQVWEKVRQSPAPAVTGWRWVRRLLLPLLATTTCLVLAMGLRPATPPKPEPVQVANTIPDKEIPQVALESRADVMPDPLLVVEEDVPLEPLPLGDLSHDYLASSDTAFEEALEGL